jgi:hypothetical protein
MKHSMCILGISVCVSGGRLRLIVIDIYSRIERIVMIDSKDYIAAVLSRFLARPLNQKLL